MIARLDKVLTIGFCLLWALFIFVDYWYYHPSYATAIQYFQYVDTTLMVAVLGGGIYWLITKKRTHKLVRYMTSGIGVYLFFMLIGAIIVWSHYFKITQEVLNFGEGFIYLGKVSYILLTCYLILVATYALGDLFMEGLFDIDCRNPSILLLRPPRKERTGYGWRCKLLASSLESLEKDSDTILMGP